MFANQQDNNLRLVGNVTRVAAQQKPYITRTKVYSYLVMTRARGIFTDNVHREGKSLDTLAEDYKQSSEELKSL